MIEGGAVERRRVGEVLIERARHDAGALRDLRHRRHLVMLAHQLAGGLEQPLARAFATPSSAIEALARPRRGDLVFPAWHGSSETWATDRRGLARHPHPPRRGPLNRCYMKLSA